MIEVGSDFSGVGAFDQALRRLGVEYKTRFACDMDLYARETFTANYGEPIYYPFDVYDRKIPTRSLEIYMTSPPCQGFSMAGKRGGSVLFFNSHEFIQENKPRYFIFENVKGLLSHEKKNPKDKIGQTFQNWITLLGGKSVNGLHTIFPHEESVPYHIYHKVLNAKHYGVPQNRERVFIIGIRDDVDNTFSWPKPFPLVKRLKDVLEDNVDEKYYLSDRMISSFINRPQAENYPFTPLTEDSTHTPCLTARYFKMGATDPYIKVKSATKKGFEVATEGDSINLSNLSSETRRGRVGKEVAQTLDTGCQQGVLVGAIRGRNPENPTSRKIGLPTEQRLELNLNGTSNALTTVQKDNVVFLHNLNGGFGETEPRIFKEYSPTIRTPSGGSAIPSVMHQDFKIRRLTPRECFRLMDFPDSFIMPCSNTQMYKQAGNSIVVNVLAKIIEKLNLK